MGGPAAGFPELGAAGAFAAPPPMPMPTPPPMPDPVPPVQAVQPPPMPPPAPPPAPPSGGFNPDYVVFHDYGNPAGQIGSFNPYNALVMPDGGVRYRDPANPYGVKAPHAFQANPNSVGLAYGGPVGAKPTPEGLASLQKEFDTIRGQYPDIKGIGHGQAYDNFRHGDFPDRPTKTSRDVTEATWRQDLTGPVLAPTADQAMVLANAGPRPMAQRSIVASNAMPPPGVPPAPAYAPPAPSNLSPQLGGILEQYTQGQPPPVPDGPPAGSPENPYSRPWATGGNIGQPPLVPGRPPESPQVASAAAAKGVEIGYGPPPIPGDQGRQAVASSAPPPPPPPTSPIWGRIPESTSPPTYAAQPSRGIGSDYASAQPEKMPWKPTPEGTPAKIAAANPGKSWTKALGKGLETAGKAIEKAKANGPKPIAVDPPRPQTAFLGAPVPRNVDMFGRPRHYKA